MHVPTASLRPLVSKLINQARFHLARGLVYLLGVLNSGSPVSVYDSILVRHRPEKGAKIKRTWVPNGRTVSVEDGFIKVVDAWGNVIALFQQQTVVTVECKNLPNGKPLKSTVVNF